MIDRFKSEGVVPISSYSVLKGKPTAGKVVGGASTHFQITVEATGGPFTVAVNIQSVDGSEVLYAIEKSFVPPSASGLAALASGVTALPSAPGGLALDYVREQIGGKPMITKAQMALLPVEPTAGLSGSPGRRRGDIEMRAHALENAVVALLDAAVASGNATVYAFGSAFADRGKVDGIHNIHMNQGNPMSNHGGDNGIWQDGALFVEMPDATGTAGWTAVFLAFQTESWMTDAAGNPAAEVHQHHMLEG
jgi:uncharacterized protein YukJ